MDVAAEIKKALIELIGANPNLPITATIVSVEGDTCTIKLLSELVLSDVRLKATISDDTDSLLITPKVGSEVMVLSQTGKLSGLVVIKVDSVEKIAYKKADFEFEVDGTTGKVTLKKQGANFGSLMNNLIDSIAGIQIINSDMTTGALNPASITQFEQIKTSFNLILNTV
ncbi:hypothetical protein [Flavobacterium sp. N1994]|uniref:hypothetical protein n=1 Tax=Flavobacterium sp. N1994 TaxID=2986827 RepID=UPI002223138A|nr:hypothetical protein [Flavobacterium sp. N1994]